MRLLALIPARGGSKRLPGKNLMPLGGKPMIVWSIDVVRSLPAVCEILVSTDDEAIAAVAGAAGADVPWRRPAELATDTATSVDVALHALDWYEATHAKVDGVLLLQPTSPLRSRSTVERGIALFAESGGRAVIGVAQASTHPLWALRLVDGALRPWLNEGGLNRRSQDLPPAYEVAGAFYLVAPQELRRHRSFFTPDALPLVIESRREIIDIDTGEDFALAQALLSLDGEAGP
jgi:CMP-N,N'-diacetyllegionaminic acid synthase